MQFKQQPRYVLKTEVDEETYRAFARLVESEQRSISYKLRELVEQAVDGRKDK